MHAGDAATTNSNPLPPSDEQTLHWSLLRGGSALSKSYSLLAMSQLLMVDEYREGLQGDDKAQQLFARALGDEFIGTMAHDADYMPVESQTLLISAASALLADERLHAFRQVRRLRLPLG